MRRGSAKQDRNSASITSYSSIDEEKQLVLKNPHDKLNILSQKHPFLCILTIVLLIFVTFTSIIGMFLVKKRQIPSIPYQISSYTPSTNYTVVSKKNNHVLITYPNIQNTNAFGLLADVLKKQELQFYSENNDAYTPRYFTSAVKKHSLNKDITNLLIEITTPTKKEVLSYLYLEATGEILTDKHVFFEEKLVDLIAKINHHISINGLLPIVTDTVNTNNFALTPNGVMFYLNHHTPMNPDFKVPSLLLSYSDLDTLIRPEYVPKPSAIETSRTRQEKDVPPPNEHPIGSGGKKMVALTFDDGPHGVYTEQILEALTKHGGHATFFMLGNRAINYPGVVQKIVDQGSQLGNHSWDHPQLTKLSDVNIKNQINRTQDAISKGANISPILVRPPYGAVNATVKSNVAFPMILWDVDTEDWKSKNVDSILQITNKHVHDGAIILMHDIYKTSAEAAVILIDQLTKKGYQLVTISQLFEAKGVPLQAGKAYTNP